MNGLRCGTYTQWNTTHKKNKIMPFAATWIQLEILILSEISQKKKGNQYFLSLSSHNKVLSDVFWGINHS